MNYKRSILFLIIVTMSKFSYANVNIHCMEIHGNITIISTVLNETLGSDFARQSIHQKKKRSESAEVRADVRESERPSDRYVDNIELRTVREGLIGEHLNHYTQDSSVAEYVKATGASTKMVRFPLIKGQPELGPEKLVVSVSEDSMNAFKKAFADVEFMSVAGHGGVIFRNMFYHFSGNASEFRLPTENTPLPMLLLTKTESERVANFLKLVSSGRYPSWENMLKKPWQIPSYLSKESAYPCCTRWIGDIPMGDAKVDHYTFPDDTNDPAKMRVAKIGTFDQSSAPSELAKVWTSPGHMQLSTVIGQQIANVKGEFASPGWVIQTLIGATSEKRVPIVFWVQNNHKKPIPNEMPLNYEEPR